MFRSGPKVPKGEQGKDSNYTLFNSVDHLKIKPGQTHFIVGSIDPARKNLAIRIELRNLVTGRIETVLWEKVNLIEETDPVQSEFLYLRLNEFFDKYLQEFQKCDLIIFERQLHINYMSLRVSQHILTYLLIKCPNSMITDVNPKLKSWSLDAPKGLNKAQLKQWAVEAAHKLLEIRRDNHGQEILKMWKKKKHKLDDLADSLVQIEGLFVLWGLPLSVIPPPLIRLKLIPQGNGGPVE